MSSRPNSECPGFGDVLEQVAKCEAAANASAPPIKIAILRDYTLEQVVPYLKFYCYRQGLKPEIQVGLYDSIQSDLLSEGGLVSSGSFDLIVVAIHASTEELLLDGAAGRRAAKVESILAALQGLVGSPGPSVLISTLVTPIAGLEGLACPPTKTIVSGIEAINTRIKDFASAHPGRVFVCDTDRIVRRLGWDRAIDGRAEMKFKAPFRTAFLQQFAVETMRLVYALKGKAKKCIVLDCDNTLWGGIIGEEGLSGIALDPASYPGSAYYQFQQVLLHLQKRGLLLALCSKNDEPAVWEVFDQHPHSVLKREHFAAWRINWERKSQNLAELASTLNLSPEAFVVVDDNPAEIEEIARAFPEIKAIPVPVGELYQLPTLLLDIPELDQLQMSGEDALRTRFFHDESERTALSKRFTDETEYLKALQIDASIFPVAENEVPRVAQLLQKTNQFNLTTRRHTEADIRGMLASSDYGVFALSARDKFGKYGLTGVFIARRTPDGGVIDSMLMSCRVLSRRLEYALARRGIETLSRAWGVREWKAEYIPTKKNGIVANFWTTIGFNETQNTGNRVEYLLSLEDARWCDLSFINITHG